MFDGEPEGPMYIFGDTLPNEHDNKPTMTRAAVRRSFRRVSSNKELFDAMVSINKATNSAKPKFDLNVLPFAKKGTLPNQTYTEIPDGDGLPRHPVYGINPDIVFDGEHNPELEAESRLNIENLIHVDQAMIDEIRALTDNMAEDSKRLMLMEGAAMLMSYDDASSFTEATLRDGLGVTVEIDASVSGVLSHLMRLNLINSYMARMSLPDAVKTRFMRSLTDKIAEDAHMEMNKAGKAEKYNAVLKNLRARFDGNKSQNNSQPTMVGPMGVVRHRSPKGITAPVSDRSEDQHDFNERQNSGVRLT